MAWSALMSRSSIPLPHISDTRIPVPTNRRTIASSPRSTNSLPPHAPISALSSVSDSTGTGISVGSGARSRAIGLVSIHSSVVSQL